MRRPSQCGHRRPAHTDHSLRAHVRLARLANLALARSAFAFIAQTWAIRRTSPRRASLLLGTEPVWAVATGSSLGSDHLTATGAHDTLTIISAT